MKLSEREQRILDELDHDLARTDPELSDLFARVPVQGLSFTDPRLADLYTRLFGGPQRARHPWLTRMAARRPRFWARRGAAIAGPAVNPEDAAD